MSDDFFDNEEVQNLAESHIKGIRSLEDKEAERILKLYRSVRRELRDRLDVLSGGSFSAQRARGVLLQVELGIAELTKTLQSNMGESAEEAIGLGVDDLAEELARYSKVFTGAAVPINLNRALIASDTKNFLINRYDVSLSSYSEGLRSRITQGISEAAVQEIGMDETISKIGRTFLGEEWRLQMIVRTELHNVYSLGKLNGMQDLVKEQMPDLKKTLFHPMDNRTGKDSIRLNRSNPIVNVDEPFVETSTGKKLVYMAPPNRPNDRAILIPYRESWQS